MDRQPQQTYWTRRLSLAVTGGAAAMLVGCASQPTGKQTINVPKPAGTDHYIKAVRQIDTGNKEAAIAQLEQAITVNPSLRMARLTLGELYVERKQYDKALPHLQVASDLDPYTLRNHYNLGLTLQLLNRMQESALSYLRALRLDSDDFKSNMNLGLVYFTLKQLDASIYHLEKATRIEPTNPRAWSNIGVAYDARGNLVFAEASYRKAIELDPDSESTLTNLTANLIAQKKGTGAIDVANRLVQIRDTPMSRKRLGDAYAAARQWDAAKATYDSILTSDPRFLPAINAKAEMLAERFESELRIEDKHRRQAVELWQQSLALKPDQPVIAKSLADYSDGKVFR